MTQLDWILVGFIALAAFLGLRRGLIAMALSLGGVVAGAMLGARLAPHLLAGVPYARFVGLGAALAGALLFQGAAALAAMVARTGLRLLPPLRLLDSLGGLLAGAAAGAVLVWVAAAATAEVPGHLALRRDVKHSYVIQRLNSVASPDSLLGALTR